jgi:hypothetical protein
VINKQDTHCSLRTVTFCCAHARGDSSSSRSSAHMLPQRHRQSPRPPPLSYLRYRTAIPRHRGRTHTRFATAAANTHAGAQFGRLSPICPCLFTTDNCSIAFGRLSGDYRDLDLDRLQNGVFIILTFFFER